MPKSSCSVSPCTFERASKISHSKIQPVKQALKSCAVHINTKSHCSYYYENAHFKGNTDFLYYYHLVCKCISIIKDTEEPSLLTCIRIFYYNVRNLKEFERQGHLSVGSNSFQQPRKEGCTCHLQDKQRCCKSNTFQISHFLFFGFVHS